MNKKILILLFLLVNSLTAEEINFGFSVLNEDLNKRVWCIFSERMNYEEVLKKAKITEPRHIKTLLEDPRFNERHFLKAVVLDYLYKNSNAEEYYKAAWKKSKLEDKNQRGIFYAYYLLKIKKPKEAIKVLRHVETFSSKEKFYPKSIGKITLLFNLEDDVSIESYLKLKKINLKLLKGEIYDCKNIEQI